MMLVIGHLTRTPADLIHCRLLCEGRPQEFTARLTQLGEGIRGLEYEGISSKEIHGLSNRDDFKAFLRALWAFADGATVTLPQRVDVDSVMGLSLGKA